MPRPDLVPDAIDDVDPATRRDAIAGLVRWRSHVPGAMALLRRAAHDPDASVASAAIIAAAEIATWDSLSAVASAIVDRNDWSIDQRTAVLDALDTPPVRPFWQTDDVFGWRPWITATSATRNRPHELAVLLATPIPDPSPATIERGRAAFTSAGCVACHRFSGDGQAVGPELASIGQCYDNAALIRHIFDPSLDIHDSGRTELVVTLDGRFIVGRVVSQTAAVVVLQTFPATSDTTVQSPIEIPMNEIESRRPSKISPMPSGLLDRLTPATVADLIAFLRCDGVAGRSADTHDHDD